ncbi:unnamed protein product [Schistocephalus solidus]|uniref:MTFR1L n=1 Tax=Schistocephalus solidus TaxID=70667 RepID=A0A183TJ98_SCHSO|nr:unnamed protein product [Schistocephalus solidus]
MEAKPCDFDIGDSDRTPLLPNLRYSQVLTIYSFPPENQHILAPASGSLNAAQLTQMFERLMKMPGIAKPQPAALSTSPVPSVSSLSHLKVELGQLAEQVASLKEPAASSSRSPPISTARPVQSSPSRPTSTATCWYHFSFGAKALRCVFLCSFV